MKLTKEGKVRLIGEVSEILTQTSSIVLAAYHGVTVDKMTELRRLAREQDIELKVVRNTLMRLSLKGTEFEQLDKMYSGPLITAFSKSIPGAAARLFKNFAKENEKFQIKAFSIGGKVFPSSEIDRLATLPNREEALTTVAVLLKMPVTKLARILNDLPTKLLRSLVAVKAKKMEVA